MFFLKQIKLNCIKHTNTRLYLFRLILRPVNKTLECIVHLSACSSIHRNIRGNISSKFLEPIKMYLDYLFNAKFVLLILIHITTRKPINIYYVVNFTDQTSLLLQLF